MSDRRFQAFHPFLRLARLLDSRTPGVSVADSGRPIALQVGEPQNQPPALLATALGEAAAGWSRYPPPRGTEDFRQAAADWLRRRYDLPSGMIDPARHILPLPGSREGLFFTALAVLARHAGSARRGVLIPNPAYHVYAGAAAAAGGRAVFVPATEDSGFMPAYADLAQELLDEVALAYLCSPANPQGSVADRDSLQGMIASARRHGFALAVDECYAEIYNGGPPPGALEAAAALDGRLDNLLVFHSLSKRSSAPGLRCGFAAGDPGLIDALDQALRFGGAGVPLPVLEAGARLWREESHVVENRERYRQNFAIAQRILGPRFGPVTPAGGFFLWLDVGDGERAAVSLWERAGIRVLPGAYMCGPDSAGANPGAAYIRLALVYDAALMEAALAKVNEVLA